MAEARGNSATIMRRARSALDRGEELPTDLRDTIRYSWIRSRLADAPRDRLAAPYLPADDSADRLVVAAEPVLSRFAHQLAGTYVSLVLADRSARVVGRWAADRSALNRLASLSIDNGFVLAEDAAGTNGIGTALEELAPVTIYGDEHYAESLRRLVCVGVPIRNPLTRRIEGVLDLACPTRDATALLLPTALDLGAQIERELTDRFPQRERVVFDEFVARSRSTSAPLVALSEQYMVTNAAAAELFDPRDQVTLWEQAAESLKSGVIGVRDLVLADGTAVTARCVPVVVGATPVGVLIEASASGRGGGGRPVARRPRTTAPRREGAPGEGAARSPAALRLERELDGLRGSTVTRVLIEGEPGSGRLAVAARVQAELRPGTELTPRSAATASAGSVARWLTGIEEVLADSSRTLVVTDVEDLGPKTARALVDLAGRHAPDALLVMTATPRSAPNRYRWSEVIVHVPALRERREDIPDLAYRVLRELGHRGRIGNRALSALMSHPWPGNLAELRSALEAAVEAAGGADLNLVHLGPQFRAGLDGRRPLSRIESLERDAIAQALDECGGNRVRAAELLGISRSTLYRRLRLFGLDPQRTVL